ncbi:MAG TPA: dihydropteroate synthase [Candidatus Omnitrophota bacterium]|nr:dihydropteroate synthase [Candidatus Omnitrophota bacterium]HPS21126.1 dihydropteroate synthase [Candidatus Omnitrophota bacterium]
MTPQKNVRTLIMGILNVTPDSFSDGGKYLSPDKAVERVMEMIEDGADIIDIGGESSRPGAEAVSAEEEIKRVLPVICAIRKVSDIPISVDTCKSEVAEKVLSEGVDMINDITALSDERMAGVISANGAGVVLMHMQGTPRTMQQSPEYNDVIRDIYRYLEKAIRAAECAGISPEKIIVDPGIGFGKTLEHNLSIIADLFEFKKLKKTLLVGLSNKSFIGTLTGKKPDERSYGTVAANAAAILNGADIVRVHDVKAAKDMVSVIDGIKKAGWQ